MSNIKILIVDDSDIDRMILKNILSQSYDVIEANSGFSAIEILNNFSIQIDALMLDISMPGMDGFATLDLTNRTRLMSMPVYLISAETQTENIKKAVNYGVTGFIKKPYDSTLILSKLKTFFDRKKFASAVTVPANNITDAELKNTLIYEEKLKRVYRTFLANQKKTDELYTHVSEVVHILLEEYFATKATRSLCPEAIEIISRAAYFYDIGRMAVPSENKQKKYPIADTESIPTTHTLAGAEIVSVNQSPAVSLFVKTAADMCAHHHERYDGQGMPHGLKDTINNIYTQMCSLAIDFCTHFFAEESPTASNFSVAYNSIMDDRGAFRPDVIEIMKNAKEELMVFYGKTYKF